MENQGKTKKQREASAKGFIIGTVVLIAIAFMLIAGKSCKAQKTGYLIAISTPAKGLQIVIFDNPKHIN